MEEHSRSKSSVDFVSASISGFLSGWCDLDLNSHFFLTFFFKINLETWKSRVFTERSERLQSSIDKFLFRNQDKKLNIKSKIQKTNKILDLSKDQIKRHNIKLLEKLLQHVYTCNQRTLWCNIANYFIWNILCFTLMYFI